MNSRKVCAVIASLGLVGLVGCEEKKAPTTTPPAAPKTATPAPTGNTPSAPATTPPAEHK